MTPEQKKLLSLFKEINDICIKHNIVYYMAGGTLIGALRHKGFIPWDDDMDIMMTRDNWLKFIDVLRNDMPEGRTLECQELNRDYPNMFGRYTDINSSAIHKNQILGDGVAGYVVDILVLDPIPNKQAHKKYIEDLMLYSDLVNPSLNYSYRYNVNKDRYNKYYKRTLKEGKDAVLTELEKEMFSYPEDECDYLVLRWGGVPFLFEKDMYGSSRWGDFEDVKCMIPDRSADYLVQHYGDDWMYIPPHNEHESHDAIFSFTTDYKTIQNDYLRYIDVPKVRKSFIKRKKFFFKHMEERLYMKDREIATLCLSSELALKDKLEKCDFDPKEALDNLQFNKLSSLFGDYLEEQLSRKYIGREDYTGIYRFNNPGFVEISDELLWVVVMLLIHTNRMAKAMRLMEVREYAKGQLTEELIAARKLILRIRKAISDDDNGKHEESFQEAKALYEEYPYNDTVNMFYIGHLLERKMYSEAEPAVKKIIKQFPENGVYDKYLGDCLIFGDHKPKEAYDMYAIAVDKTTNGNEILKIEETIVADLPALIDECNANNDMKLADLIIKLAPNSVVAQKAWMDLSLKTMTDLANKYEFIDIIKEKLIEFDYESSFFQTLKEAYIQLGESSYEAETRIKLLMSSSLEEYHQLKDSIGEYVKENKTGSTFKLLGDVNMALGLSDEAHDLYDEALRYKCSYLTEIEIKHVRGDVVDDRYTK